MLELTAPARGQQGFRHEALLYRSEEEFMAGTLPFIRDAVRADEAVLVAVSEAKIAALKAHLDEDAEQVSFANMTELGRNPARIIPAWREFVRDRCRGGRRVRGIGEPIWPGRSASELIECQDHESLLNLAFAGGEEWWLLCPYDIGGLDPDVIDAARRHHPFVSERGVDWESNAYRRPSPARGPLTDALPEPPREAAELTFAVDELGIVRRLVSELATAGGLDARRAADFVLAVNELATNSVRHAGGRGNLSIWREAGAMLCEVRDSGQIGDPLVGRRRPAFGESSGHGLWLVNQVCDLVQIRSLPSGNAVRLHMTLS
jgi:anti-sigma regulatory factor (Ser/Thr protein kinase)